MIFFCFFEGEKKIASWNKNNKMPMTSKEKQARYRARHRDRVNMRQRERRRQKKALADREITPLFKKKALDNREKKRKMEAAHGLPVAKLTSKKKKRRVDVEALREAYLRRRKILVGILSAMDALDEEAKEMGAPKPRRPKEKTILGYIRALERLHRNIFEFLRSEGRAAAPATWSAGKKDMDGLGWLQDHVFVLGMIDELYKDRSLAAKSSIVNAVTSIVGRTVNYAHVYPEYSRKNRMLAKLRAEEGVRNQLDKGREYVLPWTKLMAKVEPALKRGDGSARDRMVVRLFTLFPPRRCMDYQLMRVGTSRRNKKYNYLVLGRRKNSFVFNKYKTDKVYGRQEFPIPDDLLPHLQRYVAGKRPGDFLFESSPGLYYTSFSTVVRKAFMAMTGEIAGYPGKGMTVNDLRHSYITWWLNDGAPAPRTVGQRNELAKKMGHSRSMQDLYMKVELIGTKNNKK